MLLLDTSPSEPEEEEEEEEEGGSPLEASRLVDRDLGAVVVWSGLTEVMF